MFNQECFEIILHGGNGRSMAFEAIRFAKQNEFDQARSRLKEAKEEIQMAGRVHARLLQQFVQDESMQVQMLLVHAEDHMSSSQVVIEMANEVLDIYERMAK